MKETKQYSTTCPLSDLTGPLNMSDDCLYHNVLTPAKTADENLSGMVFFYGGGFTNVDGSMPFYNGTTHTLKGVSVVTPNFRLCALGFMANPQFGNKPPHNASGNYGIMDQQAALNWVR